MAIEQAVDFVADCGFESGSVEVLRLRLAGHDQARGVGNGGLERLAGKENYGSLHDGEDQREEGCGDQAELDRGGAVLAAHEAVRGTSHTNQANELCE